MSLTPFNQDSLATSQEPTAPKILGSHKHANSPLTFSQALTITAGMAGLVGLLSGGVVRFSLAHSPNTRALSPLQTFPDLPDSPEAASKPTSDPFEASSTLPSPLPEGTSTGGWQAPSELIWENNADDFDTFSAESFTDSSSATEPFLGREPSSTNDFGVSNLSVNELAEDELANSQDRVPATFDTFANRIEDQAQATEIDPLEALSNGPLLRQPVIEDTRSK